MGRGKRERKVFFVMGCIVVGNFRMIGIYIMGYVMMRYEVGVILR